MNGSVVHEINATSYWRQNPRGGCIGVGPEVSTGQFPSPGMKGCTMMRRLTYSHVVGIKAGESLLIGEI